MRTIILAAIGVSALALSACASRYDGYYDRYGYNHGYRSDYADRDYRYDRDRDGVPNYADRRPYNPYRY